MGGGKRRQSAATTTVHDAPGAAAAVRETSYELLISTESSLTAMALESGRSYVVGRDAACGIAIDDASVSRKHAQLLVRDAVTIVDLGSRNGTFVAGARLVKDVSIPIPIGTVVELGQATLVLQRARPGAPVVGAAARAKGGGARAEVHAGRAREDAPTRIVLDPTMKHLHSMLDIVAPTSIHVLVLGETGVGKEGFCEEVHRRSTRAHAPFLALNCAALPESILEAELFGYERGAFTGAIATKVGFFEAADGGTLFLDEIGEMPLSMQTKLLRVLELGEILRLGSVKSTRVDVRFIAATNVDLAEAVAQGRFRADLYFRLNGFTFTLPPLRRRRTEILPLADLFVSLAVKKMGRAMPRMTPDAAAALEAHDWPGNVRELRSVIERGVVLSAAGEIGLEQLVGLDPAPVSAADGSARREPVSARPSSSPPPAPPEEPALDTSTAEVMVPTAGARRGALASEVRALEKQRIVDALVATAGNQSEVARLLGISRQTLIARIEQFGLARPRKRT